MKNLLFMVKTDLMKSLHLRYIYICIFLIPGIHLINLADEMIYHYVNDINSITVLYLFSMRHALGALSPLLLFLCAFPISLLLCDEINNNACLYYIIRASGTSYIWSKVITSFILGFFCCLAGYLIFIFGLSIFYPLYPDNELITQSYILAPYVSLSKSFLYFLIMCIPESVSFAFLSVCSLLIASICSNAFAVCSFPIILVYGWRYMVGTFSLPSIFNWTQYMYNGFCVENLREYNLLVTLCYFSILSAIAGTLSAILMKRRIPYA